MPDLLSNFFSDALSALFAPLLKFLKEMLGIFLLCGGFGSGLTAIALMDIGFPLVLVCVLGTGVGFIGVVMAPGAHSMGPGGPFSERLERRRALRKYVVEDY